MCRWVGNVIVPLQRVSCWILMHFARPDVVVIVFRSVQWLPRVHEGMHLNADPPYVEVR